MGSSCSKDANAPITFREEFLKVKLGVRAARCVISSWTFLRLVGGEVAG